MMHKILVIAAAIVIIGMPLSAASENLQLKPGKHEKCPVCGMFIHKYPNWTAQLIFNDQREIFFDGAKDAFKYVFNLDRYDPGKTAADIRTVRVTDYYDMVAIDGRSAHYVIGSNIYGPMGKELIPFATKDAAEEFSKDHGGTAVLTYEQITPKLIEQLD